MIRIIPMGPTWAQQAADVEAACFSDPWSLAMFEDELQNPLAVYFAAVQDNTLIGYAGMVCVLDEGNINNVAVLPAYRGQGVAGRLIAALVDWARQNALSFLTLEVRESNRPAIRLYAGFGFTLRGRRPRYYQNPPEDALLMTLDFPAAGE